MRKVIVAMSMSLDGFVAPAKGAPDHRRLPEDPALKRIKLDWLRQVGTHVMGRVTYNEMAGHWPLSTDDYAAPMNDPAEGCVLEDPGEGRLERFAGGAWRTSPRKSQH